MKRGQASCDKVEVGGHTSCWPSSSFGTGVFERMPAPGNDAAMLAMENAVSRRSSPKPGRDEFHAYVNYAFGTETNEEMYGYEQWRQDRLLALKDKYDPQRRFSFYAPIA